jgi:hypothetical protein
MTPETVKEILTQVGIFLTTGVATLLGAWVAFRLEQRHSERRDRDQQLAAAKETLFALVGQYSIIRNLKDQHFDAYRQDPLRFLKALPIPVYEPYPAIETTKILFILESDDPDLLNHLYLAERRFRSAMGLLLERNRLHGQLQQILAVDPPPGEISAEEVRRRVGPAIFGQLKTVTDGLYAGLDSTIAQNRATADRLQALMPRLFPGRKAMKVVALPPPETPPADSEPGAA